MSELRQNRVTHDWVLIATDRARRPDQFVQPGHASVLDDPAQVADCPFCPGNEEPELERLRFPATGAWQLRVVRNKYPALEDAGALTRRVEGLNVALSGVGHHEVVIETRLHNRPPALQTVDEVERTLLAFQQRGLSFHEDPRIAYIVYFRNNGRGGGSSLHHPHAQISALPVVPNRIQRRMDAMRQNFTDHGDCALCLMRQGEEELQSRLVCSSPQFTAFVPFAAASPFHLWIVPRRHSASFVDITPSERRELAAVLQEVLARLFWGLHDPDYNYIIRSAPAAERSSPYLHWYVTIVPRVAQAAGFEMGTGIYINTTLPEQSAAFLSTVTLPMVADNASTAHGMLHAARVR